MSDTDRIMGLYDEKQADSSIKTLINMLGISEAR